MLKPKISIAIPVYNRQNLVKRAIESSLAQTYQNIEIVVVDNCSTDNTYEVAKRYSDFDSRVRCHKNTTNIGPVANWLRCIELSEGMYVKILFSDDWMEPNAIEKLYEPFEHHGNRIGFTYSAAKIHYSKRNESIICYQIRKNSGALISSLDFLWESITTISVPVSPGVALFRRDDLLKNFILEIPSEAGAQCNQYGAGNDAMLYWKCCEQYNNFYYVAEPVINLQQASGIDEPSFTEFLYESGILYSCYRSAFCYFLANSDLPLRSKKKLQTGLSIVTNSVSFRPHVFLRNLIVFKNMFPVDYRSKLSYTVDVKILKLAIRIIQFRLVLAIKSTLTRFWK